MIVRDFNGYRESADISKIPIENLAFPSKNVFVNKGKITTRGGLENDGVVATVSEATHSEFVWKDALGGQRPIRVHGDTVQVKYENKWYNLYTALDSDTVRVFFATWVDRNGSIVKKRLFFCDGSTAIYQWNGGIVEVDSYAADVITIAGSKTLQQEGFDAGDVTTQTVIVFSLDGNGDVDNRSEYTYSDDPSSGQDITLDTTPNPVPVAGDVVMSAVVKFNNEIASTYNIGEVYTYQNHLVAASYDSVDVHFSHVETYSLANGLDFTQPGAASRTALTPILLRLDGNFTAMIARKSDDESNPGGILWVSDADGWYKVKKSPEQNAYDLWVDVSKFETADAKGALKGAVTRGKGGDLIYMDQLKQIQRITSIEIIGSDEIRLLSFDVEALFARLDSDDVRLYHIDEAIYIIFPNDSTLVILDLIEGYFQPPTTIPINCMSIIDGVKYGHHNAENSTYEMFTGRDDLDTPIEAIIAFGLWPGDHPLRYKQHTIFGFSCRLTPNTEGEIEYQYEEAGARRKDTVKFSGGDLKTYSIGDDVSWATHPYGSRAIGGIDMDTDDLLRAMVFDKNDAISYFEFRPIFTISGDNENDNEFHLLSMWWDDQPAKRKLGNDLFIAK